MKTEWWGAGVVICLERGADLHMAQLMPLPLTVSCFSKIQIGFTFLLPADLGSPGQRAVKRVCVCVFVIHYPGLIFLEHTVWQLGGIVSFFCWGGKSPFPNKKDAWNKRCRWRVVCRVRRTDWTLRLRRRTPTQPTSTMSTSCLVSQTTWTKIKKQRQPRELAPNPRQKR